jgi:DNA-binding transcriptional LysR family regulator
MITLNQLRVFWAVAHSDSLTRAAKQLGVTQPALSQQLAKLENALGGQLFDRVNNQLVLSDAGRFLLRKAETVLAEIDEAEAGLAEYKMGRKRRISVGALASVARTIVPDAYRLALDLVPDLELDMHELAPAEALEQLYGRNLQIALLSPVSLAANRISFSRIDLAGDPYVFAVPRGLDLGCVTDPEWDLTPEQRRILNRTIQFNFGNLHNQRIDDWYRRVLPRHQVAAWCRTYESALAMVQAGLGVALVPQLCTQLGGGAAYDVDLHAVPGMDRPIVALTPPQYRRAQPFAAFLECLKRAAAALTLPPVGPAPPFLGAGRAAAQAPAEA